MAESHTCPRCSWVAQYWHIILSHSLQYNSSGLPWSGQRGVESGLLLAVDDSFWHSNNTLLTGKDAGSPETPSAGSLFGFLQFGHLRVCLSCKRMLSRHFLQKLWWHGSILGSLYCSRQIEQVRNPSKGLDSDIVHKKMLTQSICLVTPI